jgi:DNA-binding transcriptional LysR family regulator
VIEHLRALAVFATIVEHGSFREAARALSLSPSVVSHHVTELEKDLATPLLYRSTRRLALTPAGETLYDSAREMLSAAQRGLDALGRSATPAGELRVTVPALLAETRFCQDLAAFVTAHPRIRLTVGFSDHRRELLRERLDLALRVGRLEDSAMRVRRLAGMPRELVASSEYAASRPAPRTPKDLSSWDFIRLSSRPPEIAVVPPRRKKPVTVAVATRVSVDSAAAIRAMVLAGVGFASIPELLVRADLAAKRLVTVLPGWRLPEVSVYAVWPGGTARPELTMRFVEFIEPCLVRLLAP